MRRLIERRRIRRRWRHHSEARVTEALEQLEAGLDIPPHLLAHDDPRRVELWHKHGRWRPPPPEEN